jgi:TonB family protein
MPAPPLAAVCLAASLAICACAAATGPEWRTHEEFPHMAQLRAGECYNALFEISVAADGHVAGVSIARPSGDPRGDATMTRAVLRWRYAPRKQNGRAQPFRHLMALNQCRPPSPLSDSALLARFLGGESVPPAAADDEMDRESPFERSQSADRMTGPKACYGIALLHHPQLRAGAMTVHWTVIPTGEVQQVETSDDSLGDPELATCVRQEVAGWRFPALPAAAIAMSFRFVFGNFP